VAILNGSSVERIEFKKVENLQQRTGVIQWAGVESQYFASLVLPSSGRTFATSQIRPFAFKEKDQEIFLAAVDAPLSPGEKARVFFGPKEQSILKGTHPNLVHVIDFGWLGVVVEYLLLVLNWIYGWVRNYGWAIIILTFLITLALFPLRYKQMVAMKKMQKLQPQLKAIQERYKKAKKSAEERQKMNTETMALYKEHGVNPLGGCLPLLLQMPILFAFYSMLANSFELRGAPFMFWIQDLAAKDPYYITPLVMGVTMLISMKMTPTTTTDPMQSKMMMIMPVMMTFMFLNLSAGLNLYFLFSNVFSIAMQKVSERFLPALKTP
jgi:YidC/Oxa1 family membrane protein insertase